MTLSLVYIAIYFTMYYKCFLLDRFLFTPSFNSKFNIQDKHSKLFLRIALMFNFRYSNLRTRNLSKTCNMSKFSSILCPCDDDYVVQSDMHVDFRRFHEMGCLLLLYTHETTPYKT